MNKQTATMSVKHAVSGATISVETVRLRTNSVARPVGSLGTTGFHPAPWQVAPIRRGETPEQAFCRVNPRWEVVR